MQKVNLAKDETVISKARLAILLEKEKAHDAYLWASRRMADKAREAAKRANDQPSAMNHSYATGYRQSLLDFSLLVVDAPSG